MDTTESNEENNRTYSIVLHVQRVTTEDCYVAVPVTSLIMDENEEGKGSINFEAFVEEAIRISGSEGVDWKVTEVSARAHDIQGPIPEGRTKYDAIHDPPYAEMRAALRGENSS